MIDPRFANVGAVPFAPGYGAQQVPFQHPRHHHHRKNKQGGVADTPVSRDESIHKVDHGHHHHHHHHHHQLQQNAGAPFGNGFGVPYGAGAAGGFYQQQQQQFPGGNNGFSNQYPGAVYDQGQFVVVVVCGAAGPATKHRRRHHRHHQHQTAEAVSGTGAVDQAQGVPEQLIGQRSSSVLGDEAPQVHSPAPPAEDEAKGEQGTNRRHRHHHRHHHHHHGDEHAGFGQTHQSHQGHTTAGADGYGHINDDLIFIERGEHSPHRQEPPSDYVYKGKIEVQSIDREHHSRSQGQNSAVPPLQPSVPIPQPIGPCPPGWQQMVLSAAPGGPCPPGVPCPPGGSLYTGQLVGATGVPQAGLGGIGGFGGATGGIGFGGVGPIGAAGSGGGLANLAASLPFPPQGQLVADYIVESNASGISSSGGSGFATDYQQTGGSGSFTEHHHTKQAEEHVSSRATIIEVWQKRGKSEVYEKSPSRSRSPKPGASFDFERFRHDILGAIERMVQNSGSGAKIQWTGHDGGTQTQIHPSTGYEEKKQTEKRSTGGEVRVIVQPIQPVFYMPRQTETTTGSQIGSASVTQQASGAPHVVYVPRNVYVPVIKPVFVPRERVIVRPQVIHVARPVLVDRPVPVTQRPIIIDRERPVPVPVRGAAQGVAQTVGSETAREDYVYRDNLPVAYGGRFAENAGGVNYGYTPTQQEHQYAENAGSVNYGYTPSQQEQQYAESSTHEVVNDYQTQGPVINVPVPEQFEHSHSASHLNVQQGAGGFQESYTNLVRTSSASAVDVAPLHCTAPIEVLDAPTNPFWQRTDQARLVRLYGRPAYELVQRTDQVEQQMYQELRQRNSSGGIQRSDSAASYGSGAGLAVNSGAGSFGVSSGSFSQIPLGETQHFHSESIHHQGSATIPVCINY